MMAKSSGNPSNPGFFGLREKGPGRQENQGGPGKYPIRPHASIIAEYNCAWAGLSYESTPARNPEDEVA